MRLEETFVVDAPAKDVFATLLDLERVAPCVPGADGVERIGDDTYKARIRIKVGPITMQYRAEIEIVERDAGALRATLKVKAKETRGQGSAEALADVALSEAGGRTTGDIGVEVTLAGRAASMGQGAIRDVSARLVGAFAENLSSMLSADAAAGAGADEPVPAAAPPPPPAPPPAVDALSVGDLAGTVIAGRLRDPRVVGGLVAAAFGTGVMLGLRLR